MLRPFPSSMRAAATTPAEPAGACVARCPAAGSLPRISGGSASASPVSRPARRSLALRPAWSLSRPRGPSSSECFGRYRYLHHPLRLLPAGATVAGRDSHPLGSGAFARHTETCGLDLLLLRRSRIDVLPRSIPVVRLMSGRGHGRALTHSAGVGLIDQGEQGSGSAVVTVLRCRRCRVPPVSRWEAADGAFRQGTPPSRSSAAAGARTGPSVHTPLLPCSAPREPAPPR